jgi:hypothetical protein
MDFPQIRISNSFLFTVASKFEIRSIYHVSAIKQIPACRPAKAFLFNLVISAKFHREAPAVMILRKTDTPRR